MPVRKRGDKFAVVNKDGKTIKGGFKNRHKAEMFNKTYEKIKDKSKSKKG